MLGLLRTTLALMVVVHHLLMPGISPLGVYAISGFYIISGYLMTLVMHESYGFTRKGRWSFTINRFLRLYPQYWCAALLSIGLILWLGPQVMAGYHRKMALPDNLGEMVSNLLMAFIAWFPQTVSPRLVPATWALTVEIFFYLLICLGISASLRRVAIWLSLSVGYVVACFLFDQPWSARYYPAAAASLPFALGAAIYFLSRPGTRGFKLQIPAHGAALLVVANLSWWMITGPERLNSVMGPSYYINMLGCALLVHALACGQQLLPFSKRLDGWIGEYSYPLYLLHWQAGAAASWLIYGQAFRDELSVRGIISLLTALLMVFIVATLLIHLVDRPVQRARGRIRQTVSQHSP